MRLFKIQETYQPKAGSKLLFRRPSNIFKGFILSTPESFEAIIGMSQTNFLPGSTSQVTFSFANDNPSFTLNDVTVSGGSIGSLNKITNKSYTATFTPTMNLSTTGSISYGTSKPVAITVATVKPVPLNQSQYDTLFGKLKTGSGFTSIVGTLPSTNVFANLTMRGDRAGLFDIYAENGKTLDFKKSLIAYTAGKPYHVICVGNHSTNYSDVFIKNLGIYIANAHYVIADSKSTEFTNGMYSGGYTNQASIHQFQNCIIVVKNADNFLYMNGGTFKFINCILVSDTFTNYINRATTVTKTGSKSFSASSADGLYVINELNKVINGQDNYVNVHNRIFDKYGVPRT
jgi:hypothetical protein